MKMSDIEWELGKLKCAQILDVRTREAVTAAAYIVQILRAASDNAEANNAISLMEKSLDAYMEGNLK